MQARLIPARSRFMINDILDTRGHSPQPRDLSVSAMSADHDNDDSDSDMDDHSMSSNGKCRRILCATVLHVAFLYYYIIAIL